MSWPCTAQNSAANATARPPTRDGSQRRTSTYNIASTAPLNAMKMMKPLVPPIVISPTTSSSSVIRPRSRSSDVTARRRIASRPPTPAITPPTSSPTAAEPERTRTKRTIGRDTSFMSSMPGQPDLVEVTIVTRARPRLTAAATTPATGRRLRTLRCDGTRDDLGAHRVAATAPRLERTDDDRQGQAGADAPRRRAAPPRLASSATRAFLTAAAATASTRAKGVPQVASGGGGTSAMVDVPPELGLYGVLGVSSYGVVRPPATALGDALGRMVEFRMRNVGRIVDRAARKLGDEADEPGEVPPRVAQRIVEEASFVDDDVMQEHFAGLLACSRTEDGRDDRAVYLTNVVANLTRNQVRLHHAIYSSIARSGFGSDRLRFLGNTEGRAAINIYIPFASLTELLEVPAAETNELVTQATWGLHREGPIDPEWGSGPPIVLCFPDAHEPGLHVKPSVMGAELLWAHGHRTAVASILLSPDLELDEFDPPIAKPEGALIT